MGSIYGWVSTAEKPPLSHCVDSQRKASKCLETATSKTGFIRHEMAEVAGHATNQAPSTYQSAKYLVILEGSPQWQDAELAALSKTHGAAHAFAEGFFRDGRSVLNKIKGPFALCLFEPESCYALLAIDRIGVRPLAYSCQNRMLVFGSELDQIIGHPMINAEIDPQSIFNYMYFHVIPSPGSIYRGISKLQPGECLEFNNGELSNYFYWQLTYTDSHYSKKELFAQLRAELEQSVSVCEPDLNTGVFLSGGLDSSTVAGFYKKITNRSIDAFTMGFDAEGYDEMAYARITAAHFKINLHEYYVTPADVLQAIPLIAQTYDEPFGNDSAVPAYHCARFARELGMTCLLAGDGGDELFAGNSRYAKQKVFDIYSHVPDTVKSILEFAAFNVGSLGKVRSYIEQARIEMPERMETYNFLSRTALTEIFSGDFLKQINPDQPIEYLKSTYERTSNDDLIKKMLFLDGKFTLADNDLRKVNRMCDLAGVDVLYPMLQENLVEFAATVPSKWLIQRFNLRSFYKEGLSDFLPKETLAKSKKGFGLPFGVWMSNDEALKKFSEDALDSIAKRGFLNPDYIKKLVMSHQSGHSSYYGTMIWVLVMLEQWLLMHNL